jgi:hypothetical protein
MGRPEELAPPPERFVTEIRPRLRIRSGLSAEAPTDNAWMLCAIGRADVGGATDGCYVALATHVRERVLSGKNSDRAWGWC